jgi:hypothetical protein
MLVKRSCISYYKWLSNYDFLDMCGNEKIKTRTHKSLHVMKDME